MLKIFEEPLTNRQWSNTIILTNALTLTMGRINKTTGGKMWRTKYKHDYAIGCEAFMEVKIGQDRWK